MATGSLTQIVDSLSPEQQETVRQFIDFLKSRDTAGQSPFLDAVDEFIDQHPTLLHNLAQ